jgi:beta-phosphoglucomutase-like phosphatase (HAD superfamily)
VTLVRDDFATLVSGVTTLLCDADGTLFPSEEPAYFASSDVTNRFLAELGVGQTYSPGELQAMTPGQNFRAAAAVLARLHDRPLVETDLDRWVLEERDVVTRHLRTVLRPDPTVWEPVKLLARHFGLAAVTSSASSRLDACLEMTGLAPCFAPDRRFSAETSLPRPTSKPDPAVYVHAGRVLGIAADEGLAIEDSVNGARSAVAAGFRTVGTVQFVPPAEQEARTEALEQAGAIAVVSDWSHLVDLLSSARAGHAG